MYYLTYEKNNFVICKDFDGLKQLLNFVEYYDYKIIKLVKDNWN